MSTEKSNSNDGPCRDSVDASKYFSPALEKLHHKQLVYNTIIAARDYHFGTPYDKALKEHGYKMEIPYDPFQIKQAVMPARPRRLDPIVLPSIKPTEPVLMRQTKVPFFYRCIDMRPKAYEIHPEFMSQHVNKVKNELRAKGQWKYTEKDFTFVY